MKRKLKIKLCNQSFWKSFSNLSMENRKLKNALWNPYYKLLKWLRNGTGMLWKNWKLKIGSLLPFQFSILKKRNKKNDNQNSIFNFQKLKWKQKRLQNGSVGSVHIWTKQYSISKKLQFSITNSLNYCNFGQIFIIQFSIFLTIKIQVNFQYSIFNFSKQSKFKLIFNTVKPLNLASIKFSVFCILTPLVE